MEYQRRPISKENTIERKHKSARFSSFSLPNPCSSAKEILDNFLKSVNKLGSETIQQISMDGPNVNWSFLRLFQEKLDGKEPGLKLLSRGSCGLNVIS